MSVTATPDSVEPSTSPGETAFGAEESAPGLGETAFGPGERVAAIVYAAEADEYLLDAIAAIADQSRKPEVLILLDGTPSGDLQGVLAGESGLFDQLPRTRVERVEPGTSARAAFGWAAARVSDDVGALWFLTGEMAPGTQALSQLRTTLAESAVTGLVAPKLVEWDRPTRLQRFGIQATRTGRLRLTPRPGQPDQQQFDGATEALAAPLDGLLVRHSVFVELGGPALELTDLASDLDFGWRAQLAGHRVALAPKAVVRLAERPEYPPAAATRRDARRVALARCGPWVAPALALWMAVTSLALSLGFLLLKRPSRALREFRDLGGVLDPWRPIAARWRFRGSQIVHRRDLRGLFVTGAATFAQGADRLHDVIVPSSTPRFEGQDAAGEEPVLAAPESNQLLRNPGMWAVLVTIVAAAVAGRTLPKGILGGLTEGFRGGELTGIRATAADAWASWWDGWHGPGLGSDQSTSSGMAVLAALGWVREHVPFLDPSTNPVGSVVGLLVIATLPMATTSAYLAARVVSTRRWARALAALAWATGPVAMAAVAQGRLGALAALVILPALGAGLVRLSAPDARPGLVPATALLVALLAALAPGLLVLVALAVLAMLVAGSAPSRRKAALLALFTIVAAAPTLLAVWERPTRLLSGWGLLERDAEPLAPWRLLLLQTGTEAQWRVFVVLPLVVVGLAGLLRPSPRRALAWALAVTGLVGLTVAVALPRIIVTANGDGVASGWSGSGQLLLTLALLASALLGIEGVDLRSGSRPRGFLAWPATALGVVTALAFVGTCAWTGFGSLLVPAEDPRPAVAIDQASGPASSRTLLLTVSEDTISYAVRGREPGLPARDLPVALDPGVIADTVGQLFGDAPPAKESPVSRLASWAIGFVAVEGAGSTTGRQLDALDGLTRIGDTETAKVWRVTPSADGRGLNSPSRVSLVAGATATVVPVTGSHASTTAKFLATSGSSLVIAEPAGWVDTAIVTANGRPLPLTIGADGRVRADLPTGPITLTIDSRPGFAPFAWGYLLALALLGYLALPLGAAPQMERR